jgi:hypothetical protein
MDQNSLLDRLLPVFQFEERHGRRVVGPPGRVLDAVATLSLRDNPLIRALLVMDVPAVPNRTLAPSDPPHLNFLRPVRGHAGRPRVRPRR